jgi:Cu/Zn superoxide dismutase
VKRITKAAVGGLAGCALILGGTMAAGASTTYRYVDKLVDFSPAEGPFDSTTGKVTIVENDNGTTTFSIKITGIDISAAEEEFAAHLHTGLCVDGDFADPAIGKIAGSQAGPHYNTQLYPAGPYTTYAAIPLEMRTADTEVWFTLVPSEEDGAASFQTTVPFVPVDLDGIMSIVVHVTKNDKYGGAGARQACFPLDVPSDWIYQPPVPTG